MADIWYWAQVDHVEFAASAALLALRAQQRSIRLSEPHNIECSDDSDFEDDEEEEWMTSRPTRLAVKDEGALTNRFLDRLSELFSREKSSPQTKGRQDSKHIAASAWIRPDVNSPLTILYAKNEGPDERDEQMAIRLQRWLRAIALSGRTPTLKTDIIWNSDFGLVEFSRRRLWYHISQLNAQDKLMDALADDAGVHGQVVRRLQCLCHNATQESTVQQLSDIVNVAHILRFVWHDLRVRVKHRQVLRSINMLRRLRKAYECFKEVALTFDEVATLEITPIKLHQTVKINATQFGKHLQRRAAEAGLTKSMMENKSAKKYTTAADLHIHAEMQVLSALVANDNYFKCVHRYIGTSRKLCYLCNQILQNYSIVDLSSDRQSAFAARESHGKVYPLWTLPRSGIPSSRAGLALAAALVEVHLKILQQLRCPLDLRSAIAESSAGITNTASISGALEEARAQYLADQRASNASTRTDDGDSITLGPKVKSVKVGLLPADGSKPRLTQISFFALPEKHDPSIRETCFDLVPCFYDSWGKSQLDRRFRVLGLTKQPSKQWEGDYRIYWNINDDFPENEYIRGLLHIQEVDPFRRFWHGDVFLVRFSEHPQSFAYDVQDTPNTIFRCPGLQATFQHMWDNQFLEEQVEQERSTESRMEKLEADKEILFQRMTPVERDLLSRSPPGTLDYLATTACDDGALGNSSFHPVPHDPTKVRVTAMYRKTALESKGWQGFSSSQL